MHLTKTSRHSSNEIIAAVIYRIPDIVNILSLTLKINLQMRLFPPFYRRKKREETGSSKETAHQVILGNTFWKGREDWVNLSIQSAFLKLSGCPLCGICLVYRSIDLNSNPSSAVYWLCDPDTSPNLFEFQPSYM